MGNVDFVESETVRILVKNVRYSLQNEIIALKEKIIMLQDSSEWRQDDQIVKYEEAIQIATKLGIKDRDKAVCSSNSFREPNYCMGFRTLNVEIEFLKKRKFFDPKISSIHELEQKIALLQTLKIEEVDFNAVSIYNSAHQ